MLLYSCAGFQLYCPLFHYEALSISCTAICNNMDVSAVCIKFLLNILNNAFLVFCESKIRKCYGMLMLNLRHF
jgi:hypothetical protein